MTIASNLPHVDEHSVTVAAPPATAWLPLTEVMDATLSACWVRPIARALGCEDTTVTGPRPLTSSSTVPGFHVVADEPHELALLGRHRFSDYALILRLDDLGNGTARVRAETRAAFPGLIGKIYRTAVIGSRGHVVGVRYILRTTKRHVESR